MALLDVNALVALAWDSHVHHHAIRRWMTEHGAHGWETCPLTESGFVRVSANARVLPIAIGVHDALSVLRGLRSAPGHHFLRDDVSIADTDVPRIVGHRQVTDAHLLTLARRNAVSLLTFDAGIFALGAGSGVEELLDTGL